MVNEKSFIQPIVSILVVCLLIGILAPIALPDRRRIQYVEVEVEVEIPVYYPHQNFNVTLDTSDSIVSIYLNNTLPSNFTDNYDEGIATFTPIPEVTVSENAQTYFGFNTTNDVYLQNISVFGYGIEGSYARLRYKIYNSTYSDGKFQPDELYNSISKIGVMPSGYGKTDVKYLNVLLDYSQTTLGIWFIQLYNNADEGNYYVGYVEPHTLSDCWSYQFEVYELTWRDVDIAFNVSFSPYSTEPQFLENKNLSTFSVEFNKTITNGLITQNFSVLNENSITQTFNTDFNFTILSFNLDLVIDSLFLFEINPIGLSFILNKTYIITVNTIDFYLNNESESNIYEGIIQSNLDISINGITTNYDYNTIFTDLEYEI